MGYSRAGGKLIHEKNQKQKISWHCPFNDFDAGKSIARAKWTLVINVSRIKIITSCVI